MINYAKFLAFKAGMKLREFFSKEDGEVNIVAIVILIGIAVLLAILFKGHISNLLNSLFDTITNNAKGAIATEAKAGS